MSIVFTCPCGRQIRAKDSSSGRTFACPACGMSLEVPPVGAVDLGIDTSDPNVTPADDPDFSAPYPVARPAPVASVPDSLSVSLTRQELVSAIAEGIAKERVQWAKHRRGMFGGELLLGLLAIFSLFAMSQHGATAGVCFVVCIAGMAIVSKMP
jgi:hypothetical protein